MKSILVIAGMAGVLLGTSAAFANHGPANQHLSLNPPGFDLQQRGIIEEKGSHAVLTPKGYVSYDEYVSPSRITRGQRPPSGRW